MVRPKGGRGKKVPYNTVVMRVPIQLAAEYDKQIDEFYDIYCSGLWDGMATTDYAKLMGYCSLSKFQAIERAKKILSSNESAKLSLTKLLQVMYEDDELTLASFDIHDELC
jgi:hypothetical protein